MRNVSYYSARYRKAVKAETRTRIMNEAMLNLTTLDKVKFYRWQVEYMNSNNQKP